MIEYSVIKPVRKILAKASIDIITSLRFNDVLISGVSTERDDKMILQWSGGYERDPFGNTVYNPFHKRYAINTSERKYKTTFQKIKINMKFMQIFTNDGRNSNEK